MFSRWPPSERLIHACFSDMPIPIISRIRQENPGDFSNRLRPGCSIQNPRRTLRNVSNAVSVGIEPRPIYGDAAAPEMAIAVARSGGALLVLHSPVLW